MKGVLKSARNRKNVRASGPAQKSVLTGARTFAAEGRFWSLPAFFLGANKKKKKPHYFSLDESFRPVPIETKDGEKAYESKEVALTNFFYCLVATGTGV